MKTLINILGAGRSGTTMLDLMLGNSPDAFSLGEVGSYFRPTRKHHFTIDCSCGNGLCPTWEKLTRFKEEFFYLKLFDELNVNYVVDSSKELACLIDKYRRLDSSIRIVNIITWKDPIDLAYSHWKRGQDVWFHLNSFIKYLNRFLNLEFSFFSVRHSELTKNPARKLKSICQKIGMPYFEGKEQFWLKDHHFLFGSEGVRRQIAKKESFIYQSQTWPSEFERKLPLLEKRISEMPELTDVLSILHKYDVEKIQVFNDQRPIQIKKPKWYYYYKIRRIYKYYFPEDFIKEVS
jgi:hypothetical protein